MTLHTQRVGQIGVNVVERIVLRTWKARWQAVDSVNDDGVDGLIFLEARGEYTGQIIHVQVKCMSVPKNKSGQFRVPINREKLAANAAIWRRIVGATILVLIDPGNLEAYWVNLRDNSAFTATQILVPDRNKFGLRSRGEIRKLCGTIHADQLLPVVDTVVADFSYLNAKEHIKVSSRAFYKSLHQSRLKFQDAAAPVNFTREGWKHITRIQRSPLLKMQSFQLLGCIPGVIDVFAESELRAFTTKNDVGDLVYAQAFVKFKFRQSAIVSVVFRKRVAATGEASYSFHTIYEARRDRDLIGLKG